MKVLCTGASGFVGNRLIRQFKPTDIVTISRKLLSAEYRSNNFSIEIDEASDYSAALSDVSVIVHCAARAHVMKEGEADPLSVYRQVNTAGTLNLARQSAAAGIKRFIFISSIKVNGETTTSLPAFKESDSPAPQDPYAVSKLEAEEGLRQIADDTGMDVVIIRPPLIYGPSVKANFYTLLTLANTRLPLPFGAVNNRRSMLYVDNLVDFILQCIDHPGPVNQTFIISDGRDLSLAELLRLLRSSLGKPACLVPVPVALLRLAGLLTGKRDVIGRLVGSLQVDTSKARELLGWRPPYTVEQGIKATTHHFLKE